MRCLGSWMAAFALAVVLGGCGSSDSPSASSAASSSSSAVADQTADANQGATAPGDVVAKFLDAIQTGKADVASQLLTEVSRRELAAHGLTAQPPGTPESTFEVGRAEVLPDGAGAYVSSIWSEPQADGQVFSYEVVWVLRKESSGWRVAGMATEAVPGADPVFFNFENPGEMLQRKQEADAAILAERQEPPAATPVAPAIAAPVAGGEAFR